MFGYILNHQIIKSSYLHRTNRMLAKIACSTYFAGVGASGLYGIYLSSKDYKNLEKANAHDLNNKPDHLKKFIGYSGTCGIGLLIGCLSGLMWPAALVGKTLSCIDDMDLITKSN